jgi:hypothetical protein
MARARTSMHKIRRIIEYHSINGMSIRQISQLVKISRPTVAQYLVNFQEAHVDLATFNAMSDTDALSIMTVGKRQSDPKMAAVQAFYPYMAIELKKVGVTRQILWEEYHLHVQSVLSPLPGLAGHAGRRLVHAPGTPVRRNCLPRLGRKNALVHHQSGHR